MARKFENNGISLLGYEYPEVREKYQTMVKASRNRVLTEEEARLCQGFRDLGLTHQEYLNARAELEAPKYFERSVGDD